MTDLKIIERVEQYCVKNGEIKVLNIDLDELTYELEIPVFVGDEDEADPNQICCLSLGFSLMEIDDGEIVPSLDYFPSKLLTEDDFLFVYEEILAQI